MILWDIEREREREGKAGQRPLRYAKDIPSKVFRFPSKAEKVLKGAEKRIYEAGWNWVSLLNWLAEIIWESFISLKYFWEKNLLLDPDASPLIFMDDLLLRIAVVLAVELVAALCVTFWKISFVLRSSMEAFNEL